MTVIDLPEASRESQMRLWGLKPECMSLRVFRRPPRIFEDDPEWGEGMEPGMGWLLVSIKGVGQQRGGLTSHRGVLHESEHVDASLLASKVSDLLGFSLGQVSAVYRQGRKSPEQLALRDRIDARILAIREAGGNMVELAKALGLGLRSHGESSRVVDGALARARAARGSRMGVAA